MKTQSGLPEAFRQAPLPIVLVTRSGDVFEMEPNDLSRLLSDPEGPWFPLAHIEDWESVLASIVVGNELSRALTVDSLDEYGKRWNLDDNRTTWSVTAVRALDETWAVFALDTTGQYRYGKLLEQVLASRNAAFENLAQVAHELRQPITAVTGLSSLIAEAPSASEVEEIASLIHSESQNMAALIEDLMTAGLASSQRMRIDITPTPAAEVAHDLERLASTFLGSEVKVHHDFGNESDAEVLVDPRRLSQVVRGLIHNAVKYGGPHIQVHASVKDAGFVIEVRDDGEGVAAQDIEKIFQPFSRGEAATGTGIGLAVARSVVADMGGLLEYRPGRPGAVFSVTLHVRSDSVSTPMLDPEHERGRLVSELVAYNRDAARTRLNRLAFRYPAVDVIEEVVRPAMYEVGEQWADGRVTVSQEHHASSVVQSWLLETMARSRPWRPETVICVSSPGGHHELGTASVAVALSEAGYKVIYLGRGVPVDDLVDTVRRSGAVAVMVSITLPDQLEGFEAIAAVLDEDSATRVLVGFGGFLFAHGFPTENLPGRFLGATAREAVESLDAILGSVSEAS